MNAFLDFIDDPYFEAYVLVWVAIIAVIIANWRFNCHEREALDEIARLQESARQRSLREHALARASSAHQARRTDDHKETP